MGVLTSLIRGIRLLKEVRGVKKVIISSPLGLDTFCVMGMVKRVTPGKYALVVLPLND